MERFTITFNQANLRSEVHGIERFEPFQICRTLERPWISSENFQFNLDDPHKRGGKAVLPPAVQPTSLHGWRKSHPSSRVTGKIHTTTRCAMNEPSAEVLI